MSANEALSLEQRVEDVLRAFGKSDSGHISNFSAEAIALVREQIAADIEAEFTGLDYQENAASAAGEGEWSWFRWLAAGVARGGSS